MAGKLTGFRDCRTFVCFFSGDCKVLDQPKASTGHLVQLGFPGVFCEPLQMETNELSQLELVGFKGFLLVVTQMLCSVYLPVTS